MTPELIRAAELIDGASSKDVFGDNPGGPKSGDFWDAAEVLSQAILAHRSDYSENGEELPVDPEFCREMGMTLQSDGWSVPFYELLLRDIAIAWWPETQSLSLGDSILHEPMTRSQLRNLLSALGIGGAA